MASADINRRLQTGFSPDQIEINHMETAAGNTRDVKTQPPNFNPLKPELNPICYLLALLRAHHFLHVSRIRVKLLTLR